MTWDLQTGHQSQKQAPASSCKTELSGRCWTGLQAPGESRRRFRKTEQCGRCRRGRGLALPASPWGLAAARSAQDWLPGGWCGSCHAEFQPQECRALGQRTQEALTANLQSSPNPSPGLSWVRRWVQPAERWGTTLLKKELRWAQSAAHSV